MPDARPLSILVADDEALARRRLRELLAEIPGTRLVAEAASGLAALQLAQLHQPQVLLLDIRMPQMDGIEAAGHAARLTPPPAVIFTTAFDAHAMQAFDMHAVDYLLKPIRRERLEQALNRARALLPAQLAGLPQPPRSHFSVSERGRVLLIPVAEVLYLRAELKYLTLRTAERTYLLDDTLTRIEQEFPAQFVRLHRNCLAAPAWIRGFERHADAHGDSHWVALLRGVPDTLPVSRRQQHIVHALGG